MVPLASKSGSPNPPRGFTMIVPNLEPKFHPGSLISRRMTIVDPRASWLLRNPFSWASSSMAVVFAASTCGILRLRLAGGWVVWRCLLYLYTTKSGVWHIFTKMMSKLQTITECLRGVLEILVVFHENLLFSLAHTPSNAQANLTYSRNMSSHRASTGSTPKVVFSPTILHTCNLKIRKVAKCCPQNIAVLSFQHLWVSCRGFAGNFGIYIYIFGCCWHSSKKGLKCSFPSGHCLRPILQTQWCHGCFVWHTSSHPKSHII